jgi:two-component system response regulator
MWLDQWNSDMAVDQGILLVEDNPDEETLTLRAMRRHKVSASIEVAHDGVEALKYVFDVGDTPEGKMPRFVILDLKLPRVDGFDVITCLRADPRTRLLPVVVFSSSSEGQDVRRCYQLGANAYVVKPVAAEEYQEVVRNMVHFWLNQNLDPYLRK